MKTILLSHALYQPGMDILKGKAELIISNNGDAHQILAQLQQADGYILRIGRIDRAAIEACPRLKVITRPGVGVDNVDVAAATEHGIPVVICRSGNARAVAEHTLTLLLAVSKNLYHSVKETAAGNFSIRNQYAAVDVLDKRIAVLGAGQIGRCFAGMCYALGMRVTIYDPFLSKEEVYALNHDYHYAFSLQQALAESDYVSLHMPSTAETRGMFGREQFEQMKNGAFLINCARGDLVDEDALYHALQTGKLSGAGLDVLAAEPFRKDHPLFNLPNVIITPHMAAQTRETTAKIVCMAAEGTLAVLNHEQWPHVCNPEVYQTEAWKNAR